MIFRLDSRDAWRGFCIFASLRLGRTTYSLKVFTKTMKNLLFYAILAAVAMTVIASACSETSRPVSQRYVGTLPAADGPGIVYDLTLNPTVGDSTTGRYVLSMTYREAEQGRDMCFDSKGDWTLLRGIPDDSTALFYRLIEASDRPDTTDFLYLGDSVMLLGTGLRRPQSALNYTLVRVAE